jgi:xanthine/uracil/vitamin C permease (AzgA family)
MMGSLPATLTQGHIAQLLDWAFMYAKTNPRAGSLTSRQKRVFAIVGVLVIVVLGGLGAWGLLASDIYGNSAHGCVNVTVPSSTGGATLHYCGKSARSFCQKAFRSQDQISLRARPQCVLAGFGPASPSSPSSQPS